MCAAHSFLWTQPRVLSTMENPGVKGSFCGGYPARDQRFPSLLPIAEPRRGQGAATSPSPTSFSIPQTSRVSNAPVLRNIRRSSRRNHRLLGRETTLKGTLSSRKIKGGGEGGRRRKRTSGPTPPARTPPWGCASGDFGSRTLHLPQPSAGPRAEGGAGKVISRGSAPAASEPPPRQDYCSRVPRPHPG